MPLTIDLLHLFFFYQLEKLFFSSSRFHIAAYNSFHHKCDLTVTLSNARTTCINVTLRDVCLKKKKTELLMVYNNSSIIIIEYKRIKVCRDTRMG